MAEGQITGLEGATSGGGRDRRRRPHRMRLRSDRNRIERTYRPSCRGSRKRTGSWTALSHPAHRCLRRGDVANQLHPSSDGFASSTTTTARKWGARRRGRCSAPPPYDYIHTFWSDQYDHKLEYVGHATEWDTWSAGAWEEGNLIGFYLWTGLLQAAVGLTWRRPRVEHRPGDGGIARLVADVPDPPGA